MQANSDTCSSARSFALVGPPNQTEPVPSAATVSHSGHTNTVLLSALLPGLTRLSEEHAQWVGPFTRASIVFVFCHSLVQPSSGPAHGSGGLGEAACFVVHKCEL